MTESRHTAYADAVLAIARAEGATAAVESELSRFTDALRGSEDLAKALADPSTPAPVRMQIVDDLLAGKVSNATLSIIALLVANGRGGDIPAVTESFLAAAAGSRGEAIAEVRSAVPLTDDQKQRLAAALKQQTKTDVSIRNIVDPSVVGGIVTQIGDTLLDGSVRTRLNQLREAF